MHWGPVSLYGCIVASYLLLQLLFAILEHRRQRHVMRPRRYPVLTVVLPSYNPQPEVILAGVRSLMAQDYPGRLQVIVVDDGSALPIDLAGVHDGTVAAPVQHSEGADRARKTRAMLITPHIGSSETYGPGQRSLDLIRLPKRGGKRHAQKVGFDRADGKYIASVDDDTVFAPDALTRLVDLMESDPRTGAASGSIRVRNRHNLFTLLIDLRYWSSNHLERASQSYFGVGNCCSGPLSIYRGDLIDLLKDEYVSQRFLGRECTYGDDRHMTNLVLRSGYDARFAPWALAWTMCPESLRTWLRQQRRWSMSFYREVLISLRFIHRRNVYFGYNLLVGALLPALLLWGMICAGVHLAHGHWSIAAKYAATIILMGWLRGGCGFALTGDTAFLLMPIYSVLHMTFVTPVRILAVLSLWDTRWGTR